MHVRAAVRKAAVAGSVAGAFVCLGGAAVVWFTMQVLCTCHAHAAGEATVLRRACVPSRRRARLLSQRMPRGRRAKGADSGPSLYWRRAAAIALSPSLAPAVDLTPNTGLQRSAARVREVAARRAAAAADLRWYLRWGLQAAAAVTHGGLRPYKRLQRRPPGAARHPSHPT